MAIYHPHKVQCLCGNEFTAHLARSVNAARTPEIKEKIIEGTFHSVSCPECERRLTVEKEFSYTDLPANVFIKVKVPGQRHLWKQASAALTKEVELVPKHLIGDAGEHYRVVFGLAELREKLIAREHKLDDRHIELMKVMVMYEHPFLAQKARLRIVLDKVNKGALEFIATFDHDNKRYRVKIPKETAEHVFKSEQEIKNWVKRNHKQSNIFEMKDDHWVNIWRWSPQTSALSALKDYSDAIENGEKINTRTAEFKNMLVRLPKGNHLPPWAKQSLRSLFTYAEKTKQKKLTDTLFEIRFNKVLDDDWAYNNKPGDIDTIWQLLQDLPDTHIEGNTRLDEITLAKGGGGFYDNEVISMGAKDIGDEQYFQDTIRHEVGHAVHEQHNDLINDWLKERFGWQLFDPTPKGIDAWVGLMGGWGKIKGKQKADIIKCLLAVLGPGSSWAPGTLPEIKATHPWKGKDCMQRLVFENCQKEEEWFKNYENWYCANGKVFFLNYYYQKLCVINDDTRRIIANLPSNYSAMSHFEFFAELYAVYYNPKHPLRKKIPKDVKEWLDKNIG